MIRTYFSHERNRYAHYIKMLPPRQQKTLAERSLTWALEANETTPQARLDNTQRLSSISVTCSQSEILVCLALAFTSRIMVTA